MGGCGAKNKGPILLAMSKSVITSSKGPNILCRYKPVLHDLPS